MSPVPLVLVPSNQSSDGEHPLAKTCAFGANCNCVFSRSQTTAARAVLESGPAPLAEDVLAEVTTWTDLGFHVVEQRHDDVTLERTLALPFCANVLLGLVTGGLWLFYVVPRTRHPKIATRRITRSLDGSVEVARGVERR